MTNLNLVDRLYGIAYRLDGIAGAIRAEGVDNPPIDGLAMLLQDQIKAIYRLAKAYRGTPDHTGA